MSKTINELVEAARIHFENVQADIVNASTRIEHIRITTLAQEAAHLLTDLEKFATGSPDLEDLEGPAPTSNEPLVASGCCGGSKTSDEGCHCSR
jgi:hypothetical protein